MSRYSKGQRVVAVKDISRWSGGSVSKGSKGVVVAGGFGTRAKVEFTVGGFFGGGKKVIAVDDNEIKRA